MNRRTLSFLSIVALLLPACTTLDRDPPKPATSAMSPASGGSVAAASKSAFRLGSGNSGFHLITKPEEAMNWRLAFIDSATRSLDIQYYQWANDEAGLLVFNRVVDAAERGVRVRLLVDDFLYGGEEERLASICQHPNISIRIFNPQRQRAGKLSEMLEFMGNFGKLNQRMHNKMLVADNRLAIMGGRNIGNYYYGISEKANMLDVDVIAGGLIVKDISASFDEYWNSKPTYPGKEMAPGKELPPTEEIIAELRARLEEEPGVLPKAPYSLRPKDWSQEFASLSSRWIPGKAEMLSDEPTTSTKREGRRLLEMGYSLVGREDSTELLFVSPYLVPTKETFANLEKRTGQGVDVRLLAPGLGSNNQPVVHSHYRQHRRGILKRGAELHEVREDGTKEIEPFTTVLPDPKSKVWLHAKVGVGDRKRCFIGSMNLDPRSQEHNMENGLFIESPALAGQLADHIEFLMNSENAWEVTQEENGSLLWRSRGEEKRTQPGPGGKARLNDFFFGLVPVKGLL